jgi:multidrug efflux pump subunit AcrA (membrane-fusion protein)
VRVEAYPDAKFEGVVSSVGVLAVESNRAGRGGQAFPARGRRARGRRAPAARHDRARHHRRRPRAHTLAIPVAALHYDGAQPTCYVHDGYAATPRKVTVGRRGDDLLEITAGLAEGERVVLARP